MKHYDYIEWLFYKNKMLSEEKSYEMEQHLYNCDICIEIFLSLIDDKEVEKAGEIISNDFASKIINIPKTKTGESKVKQTKKIFDFQFGYYAAVAAVTIILTLGGVYIDLVDAVPKLSASIQTVKERPNIIADFSDNIIDSTSSFIFSIENIDRNRREKNER